MTVTLVATPKSASANSYVDVATADTYFSNRLNADAWSAASADDKARALIMASSRLDAERWQGLRTDPGQALAWPRGYIIDDSGTEWNSDIIPLAVANGCCELALALLTSQSDLFADSGLEPFQSAASGSQSVTLRSDWQAAALPAIVNRMVSRYKAGGSGFAVVRG